MVTASHNPKAYTGVKLVREGALPLSGDAGIGDVKAEIEAGLGEAPGGGNSQEVDVWDEFHAHALSFIDAANVRPMKVVVDGGNGMARADGRPDPRAAAIGAGGDVLRAERRVPRPRAEPAAGGEPADDHRPGSGERRRPWDRLGRRRRPLLLHRRQRQLLRRRLHLRPAGTLGPAEEPRGDDPLRPALEPRGARLGRRRGRPLRPLPRRPRLLQGADARGGGGVRRRGLWPLLLPRLLERRLGDDPGAAGAGAALARRSLAGRADGGVPLPLLHLRRDQLRGRGPGGEDGEIEERYGEGAR